MKRKTERLRGIACKFNFPGAIILDARLKSDRPKFVGVVRPAFTKKGYVLCPFVQKAFIFRTVIPKEFKSPDRAWEWLTHHTTGWTYGEHQTSTTPLLNSVLRSRRRWRILTDFQIRRALGQVVLAAICALWAPESINLKILAKISVVGLLISAAIDTLEICRRYL